MSQAGKSEAKLEQALRQKFVLISISVVFVVLFCIFAGVNGFNFLQVQWKAQALVEIIAENGGTFPRPPSSEGSGAPQDLPPLPDSEDFHVELIPRIHEESSFVTRFFTVKFLENGEIDKVDTTNINRTSVREAHRLGEQVYQQEDKQGMWEPYYFQEIDLEEGESLVIFLDMSEDLYFFQSFLISSGVICCLAVCFVLLLLLLLSRRVVAPIVESYARQKSFITDMSHELKTPLAIVKANTEVMELEQGVSSWSISNHKQVEKLNSLVNRMLTLAKLEEADSGPQEIFSLTQAAQEAGENLRPLVEQEGKELKLDLPKDIKILGNLQDTQHLLEILLENAVKYSSQGSSIFLEIGKEKHNVLLSVWNQGNHLKKGSYDRWFQRFYREEGSRNSETGGFGLGLSMAKRLVKNQGGRITADSPDGLRVRVCVEFKGPNHPKGNGKPGGS